MQNLLNTLLICSGTMAALALLFLALSPFLSKRYGAKWLYYAWLVVVIGFILPCRPHFDFALFHVEAPIQPIMLPQMLPQNIILTSTVGEQASVTVIPWLQIIFCVWIAGMLCTICYHLIRHYRFMRMAKRWSEKITDEPTLKLLQDLKSEMGITKNIGMQLCPCVGSPLMLGFANPQILLSTIAFSNDELRFILKHELIHYKRRDLWYKCSVLVAIAIHWFNPVVYLMAKAIEVQCEISCDSEVVRSADSIIRQHYSETIIGVIRHQSKLKTALSTNFYGGKKGMKKRIFSILDTGKKKAGAAIVCAVMIATVGTGFTFAANASDISQANNVGNTTTEKATDKSIAGDGARAMSDEEIKQMFAEFDRNNAGVYSVYEKYGLTYNKDENRLYYDGKLVRYFEDNQNTDGTFGGVTSANADGSIDVHSVRNSTGALTGVEAYNQTAFDARTSKLQKSGAESIVTGNGISK